MAKIRTKARTLDMLGRQQIAGIPTALSELFKNAHDAYADNVEVDFIRKKDLLIIRDDGVGMTKAEFEERWLTIGTDSKFDDEDSLEPPAVDLSKKKRPVMGEKGIGRLAIAAIGPQVLVLTRARRENKLENLVAAFINWTLFSLPALDLEDIDIPIIVIEQGKNITKEQISELLNQAKLNVKGLTKKISEKKISSICTQIDSFNYDPPFWAEQLIQLDNSLNLKNHNLRVDDSGSGTHFIISPVDEILPAEIEGIDTTRRTEQASRLEKALLGFTNTMYSDSSPPIVARFRDHTLEGECIDRISESIFFTPSEFNSADHHFEGQFDEFGQFNGTVQVYGNINENVVVPWLQGQNRETLCGPFRIKLAYVQGNLRDSKIPSELWYELTKKIDLYGGLYIYRDGIRILPYGDSDFDFLKIEQRRTKSFKEYFFSYRRMFGAIELNKELNSNLQEKAGREGFVENKAYKQFKGILENFFIKIATDFFVDKGDLSDIFFEQRARQQEQYELIKKRENLKSEKKKKLQIRLQKFYADLDSGYWQFGIEKISNEINQLFSNFHTSDENFDDLVFNIQQYLNTKVKDLKINLNISIPSGFGFGKEITNQLDRYQVHKKSIELELESLEKEVEKKLASFEDQYGNRVGLRRRFYDSLEVQQLFHKKKIDEMHKEAEDNIKELIEWATKEIKNNKIAAKEMLDQIKLDFASTSFTGKTSEDLYSFKHNLELKITESTQIILNRVENLSKQIKTVHEGSEEYNTSSNELMAALESEYEHLKEQHDSNIELVQLGMALGVVHHEFNNNIFTIRRGIKELQPWAIKNQKLLPIYEKIKLGFEHLEGYLRVFTPLSRRLARKRTIITGRAISQFLTDVFFEKVNKENIKIEFSENFLAFSVEGFTSTIYPAFVNLLDNSIYWLSKSTGERKIILDADNRGFIIKDTGPGIPTIDSENVFDFGFTRRIGGQGMGLYVVRQTLERDNFEILLDTYTPNCGAVFRIFSKKNVDV